MALLTLAELPVCGALPTITSLTLIGFIALVIYASTSSFVGSHT